MNKIKFLQESSSGGVSNKLEKEIDVSILTNNIDSDEEKTIKLYNNILIQFFDFISIIGLDTTILVESFDRLFADDQEHIESADQESELSFDSFCKQFNENEDFKQKVFSIFQMYMKD